MPPVLINYVPHYHSYYPLSNNLNEMIEAKNYRKNHCSSTTIYDEYDDDNKYCNDKKYSKYDNLTMMNWEDIFDLSEIRKHIKMINRDYNFSLNKLKNTLNIKNIKNNNNKDIYLFIENETYEYKFFDNKKSKEDLENFQKKFFIKDFLKIKKKLLHFTSLFSHYKLSLENDDNKKFRNFIHNKLIINNKNILNITNNIINKLGGKNNYFGLHIRLGDGIFKDFGKKNINLIFNKLIKKLNLFNYDDLLITAHSGIFIGTENSTFSRMAYEVNNLSNGKDAMSTDC
ncbi:5721_t:CDS:2 [Rhizophagus irregularis]|nr:5721_t:CDS:2 [Rhizophagus irregularis]